MEMKKTKEMTPRARRELIMADPWAPQIVRESRDKVRVSIDRAFKPWKLSGDPSFLHTCSSGSTHQNKR
ncbi:hypothetical protein CRG98_022744 [Punica granatum]|uniref:Uncharacterized protein n=1 Tax=Punica granatum TaxID=22663 RepID=A0A2I0JKV8_PUNGR|nr:hypothetical protein CRG98_022744 [Punica granatum]